MELQLIAPSMDDQTDDWGRLCTVLRKKTGIDNLDVSVDQIRRLGRILRDHLKNKCETVKESLLAEDTPQAAQSRRG